METPEELEPKYSIGMMVFYMHENKVHSAEILSRMVVDNIMPFTNATPQQRDAFLRFGNSAVQYSTVHGIYEEKQLFPNKPALLESL